VKLLRTQFALDDSQFFSTVEVATGTRDPATHLVPIEIRATSARNGYSFGVGYGTDTGARGTASWLNPRINDRGHRMRVQVRAAQTRQDLNARYDIPFGDPVREKFSMQLLTQTQDLTSTLHTRELSFRPSITQSLGNWQRSLSASFAHNVTTGDVNGRQVDNLVVPGITYSAVPEGYLGEDLFSRKLYAELIGSHSVLGANANFLRLDLQSERVLDLNPRWHLLLRAELGASAVGDFQELPAAYRFFAGGDRSVRGFSFNSLSPREFDPLTKTYVGTGGRHLLTGTFELERDLPHSLGVAAFADFGNAFNRIGDPLAYSVGLGFRWRLPVITVGIDIAKAVRAPGFAQLPGPRLHLNISPKL
jgi:translocation and assembly module TamA